MTDSYWGNIFRSRSTGPESFRAILERTPIFESLTRREYQSLEHIVHRRHYRAGEEVFAQNDPAAGMYIIERGTVDVIFDSTQQVLAELSDGEFFGELALLDDAPRSATVRAKTNCDLLAIFHPDLFDLIERNPKLGVKILTRLARIVGERLRRSNEQVQEMREELHKHQDPE